MTDPANAVQTIHGRFYIHPGTRAEVPSITNIINMKSKPLFKAGLNRAAKHAAKIRATLAGLDEESAYTLVSNPPREPDDPAEIGNLVHAWAERFIKAGLAPAGEEWQNAPQTAKWMWETWLKFVEHYKPEFTDSEFTVWSDEHGYAGTADFSAYLGKAHVLVDIKTGKAAYPEVAMQLAAIANADFILGDDGTETSNPHYGKYAVLHLRPRGARLHPVGNIEPAFRAFLGLKAVFDWNIGFAPKSILAAPKIN
jgi:hypothetical protein